ncbi:7229_t:CDS:2 [Diversispora eburnea]|uniref:7229_t:CDS:1 n=1 Tax=Diversispora eburnea TaxID=1213867 RepID=A0A9N9FVB2_9GLOM|nr:7229_t:CDS:2 [Diversispora eburnea]
MKSQLTIYAALLLFILTFTQFNVITFAIDPCLELTDDYNSYKLSNCQPVKNKRNKRDTYNKRQRQSDIFRIETGVSCKKYCSKIKNIFLKAGRRISKVLTLNPEEPIYVYVVLKPLDRIKNLASTTPNKFMPLISEDRKTRLYPQALVKQFDLEFHSEYAHYDIVSKVNSDINWWWGDGQIKPNQYDLELVALHELIHGLGFKSSWTSKAESYSYEATGLTPIWYYYDINWSWKFAGFFETIFDRQVNFKNFNRISNFIINNTPTKSYYYVSKLNSTKPFNFTNKLIASKEWKYAKHILAEATTTHAITFEPLKHTEVKGPFYLETSLKPFIEGVNIINLSKEYKNSADFLMTYPFIKGSTLDSIVKNGNYESPFGPKTIAILESMGYSTPKHPYPTLPTFTFSYKYLNNKQHFEGWEK